MKHYHYDWIVEWCQENGWTDVFEERANNYWAFPPGAVMPEPIPNQVLRLIKTQKGMTAQEKFWSISAVIGTIAAVISTYVLKCPMPLVLAFAFDAVTAARLEIEEA
ncbi:slr1957 family protein [Scytonema sp. NUACC21]